ncbi:MAG: S-adenosyl-L-homocysteine hydrolase [Novosphingobium sp.]|nr:S-adenosyl-L-homocysteine hydrolase [Novosphingobium sp.]
MPKPEGIEMGIVRHILTGLLATTALFAPVLASAAGTDLRRAEKLQQLDVLLMISSLRCLQTGSDFTTAYDHFSEVYAPELREARSALEADYAARFGSRSAKFAVDRLSTRVANTYGEGHPALDCAELGEATRALASHSVPGGLEEAADQLLTTDLALADLAGDY